MVLWLGAAGGSLAGFEVVRTWFYVLAWWGYILIIDAWIKKRAGNSLIRDRRGSFWLMCGLSCLFWFFWELINLRLHNWHYHGVPQEVWLRWPGMFLSYATVLPGVLETYEMLGLLGLNWSPKIKPLTRARKLVPWFSAAGVIMLVLPLLWPRLFFPLVWLGLIFILEPIIFRKSGDSLLADWQKGDMSRLARLLAAGLVCGLCWESWNFLAGARWSYSLPYLNQPRLFAMPLAGYLGFAPFAVECYVLMAWVGLARGGRGWQAHDHQTRDRQPLAAWLGWTGAGAGLVFNLIMCHLIDIHLVKGWAS